MVLHKLRNCFDEMVVYKDLRKTNFFFALSLPSFMKSKLGERMNAANGAILSDAALDLLIQMLEPNNLPEQYYFGTSRAASLLKLKGRSDLK
jgi:hypothetical protein